MSFWKKIDLVEDFPAFLEPDDACYYAREYISGAGWQASVTNSLIFNLKKDVSRRGTPEWRHKENAAYQFAKELNYALPDNAAVAFIPTSKCESDPQHDPRWAMVADRLLRQNGTIHIEEPIIRSKSYRGLHRGDPRNIRLISQTLSFRGFSNEPPGTLILIDDIITRGTSFTACKNLILEHHGQMRILGCFWARVIRPDTGP